MDDREYCRMRAAQEQEISERAPDPIVRQIHADLAKLYRRRGDRRMSSFRDAG